MAGGADEIGRGEQIGRIFADITDELEQAHDVSVEGQNSRRSIADRRRVLGRLYRRLDRCASLITELSILLQR